MIWAAANANLALVKYWGKASAIGGNQAASGSLSVTLDGLVTVAGARVVEGSNDEVAWFPPGPAKPVVEFLDALRSRLGIDRRFAVAMTSSFPVAAGLASSASAFAALTTAVLGAARVDPSLDERATLARLGSGSACRSLLGGFVEWNPAAPAGGVRPVPGGEGFPLAIVVAVTREAPKEVGSREGMKRTAATSPYYPAWLEHAGADLAAAREAVAARDLPRLGALAERNCLRMHAAALAADPPLLYWEPATVAAMREVARLRESGVGAWFSIDAGPQVKVLCAPGDADRVEARLGTVPGVVRTIRSRPGGAPEILAEPPAWVAERVHPSEPRRVSA